MSSFSPARSSKPLDNWDETVIEYLSKKGYSKTEAMLRAESANTDGQGRPIITRAEDRGGGKYFKGYAITKTWIDENLDVYKPELKRILWPLFIYSFIGLVTEFYPKEASEFFNMHKDDFVPEREKDLNAISSVTLPEHLNSNEVIKIYRNKDNKYRIPLSSMAFFTLVQFLESREKEGGSVVVSVLQENCDILTRDSSLAEPHTLAAMRFRREERDMPAENEGIVGHHINSAAAHAASVGPLERLKLGRRPMELDHMTDVKADLADEDQKNPPLPGQNTLTQEFEKEIKREEGVDSPSTLEVPLPPSTARDVAFEVQRIKENRDRFSITDRTGGVGPGLSVVMHTFHNTYDSINCLEFSPDNLMVAAGMDESYIRVWSLDGKALPSRVPENEKKPSASRRLVGHSGPVTALSFSPGIKSDNTTDPSTPATSSRFLLSSSVDKSVRLWLLETWTCMVVYKGHDSPVWDVAWGPFGHYFVSGSHDKTARLWATDHISCLRIFAGHDKDVDVVAFHPNSAYVFTGSCDFTVRMWALSTGASVRAFSGHTNNVTAICCSPSGKLLASADDAGAIILWELGSGKRIKRMRGHGKGGIWSLSWSAESNILVSGGADCTVRVWDVFPPTAEITTVPGKASTDTNAATKVDGVAPPGPQGSAAINPTGAKKKGKEVVITPDQISAFPTKKSPVYQVKFTRQNLVLAGGAYLP